MALKQKIIDAMKQAMRARDKRNLSAIRLILAEIKQVEVDQRIETVDTEIVAILDKMLKKRHDAIEQFKRADRQDLVDQEELELKVIQQFLPEPLSEQEISNFIQEAIIETGANSKKDMGKLMTLLRPKVVGRTDMKRLSQLVSSYLA